MSNVIEFTIKAIDDFSANMGKITGSIGGIRGAFAALGVAAAAYTALNMGKASLENAEAMGVAAEKANMTTEAFSALAWAAKQSNVEQGALTTGIKMLGRAMSEGDASKAGQSLRDLGVAATDANGNLRPTIDVLMDVADQFSNAAQDANKTKIAMELFGRSGVDMVPMLNQGRGAIEAMMKEAQQLGFVISGDFAKSADQINDNLAAMAQVMRGQVDVAMEQLAPTIELITGTFIDMAKEGDVVKTVGDGIATVFKTLFTGGMVVVASFDYLTTGLGMLVAGLFAAKQAMTGDFAGAQQILNEAAEAGVTANDNLAAALERIKGMWDGTAQSVAAASAAEMRAAMRKAESLQIVKKEEEDLIAADKALSDSQNAAVRELELSAATFGMSADQVKLYKLALSDADPALVQMAYDSINAKTAAEEHAASLVSAAGIIQSTLTPLELHEQALVKINAARAQLTDGQFDAALASEEERWAKASDSVMWYGVSAASVSKGISNSIADAVVDSKNLADALQRVLQSVLKEIISHYAQTALQRKIFAAADKAETASTTAVKIAAASTETFAGTYADVSESLPYGWIYAGAIAAAAVAAMVAGAAHGGLDYVPSEATYLLDRGERVLSPRQNQDLTAFMENGGGGGNSGGVVIQSLVIHVLENATNVDAFARMDRVQLRNVLGQPVVDALNEMFSIGVRPNFAMQNR